MKASIVERFNRTLKERLERFFTENKTKNWISVLPELTNLYNNTYHNSIGMPPSHVNMDNANQVRQRLYRMQTKAKSCNLKPGDVVRIPIEKNIYSKGIAYTV